MKDSGKCPNVKPDPAAYRVLGGLHPVWIFFRQFLNELVRNLSCSFLSRISRYACQFVEIAFEDFEGYLLDMSNRKSGVDRNLLGLNVK